MSEQQPDGMGGETARMVQAPAAERAAGRWRLLVLGERTLAAHPLPASGTVVIGRGAEAGIAVDEASVSRRHAELELGSVVRVRDLGSVNGTRVAGTRVEPQQWVTVPAGATVEVGAITLVLQPQPATGASVRPRLLLAHGYFETRVEEECARAEATGLPFALMRVRCSPATLVRDALAELLEPTDVAASYGPDELELLLPGTAERARALGHELEARAAAGGAKATVGLAAYGPDGRSPEELIARAAPSAGAAPAEASGITSSGVVVVDPVMRQLHEMARRVAQSPLSVLLLGETGVGKEVFAEAIHRASPRAEKPLLRLNCAGFTESLLESELFGYEKGAFTGAVKAKEGLLESANGGTVFLDEIGEMPLGLQAKLLRVIEQREVQRVGELRPRPIDVRFVAATNRDLESESARGTFRQDLYFRLNGITLMIPPLRDRPDEIEPLARALVSHACRTMGRSPEPILPPDVAALLRRYHWPGNVRELKNAIDRAVVLCPGEVLRPEHFPLEKLNAPLLSAKAPAAAPARPDGGPPGRRERILEALERCGGNQSEAAKLLGVSRKTLMAWMDVHGIARPRKRE